MIFWRANKNNIQFRLTGYHEIVNITILFIKQKLITIANLIYKLL